MIVVTACPEECFVEVTGHAGSGPKGQDLVCAGVSALVLTLEEAVKTMARAGWLRQQTLKIAPGNAEIRCTAKQERLPEVQLAFAVITAGFHRLARQWPEYVSCQ